MQMVSGALGGLGLAHRLKQGCQGDKAVGSVEMAFSSSVFFRRSHLRFSHAHRLALVAMARVREAFFASTSPSGHVRILFGLAPWPARLQHSAGPPPRTRRSVGTRRENCSRGPSFPHCPRASLEAAPVKRRFRSGQGWGRGRAGQCTRAGQGRARAQGRQTTDLSVLALPTHGGGRRLDFRI